MTLCDFDVAETPAAVDYERVIRTIVFTDIVGSTQLADRQGDDALLRVTRRHDILVELNASAWCGEVVKRTGDGAMLAFDRACFAVMSALQIQRQAHTAGIPLTIGIDHGEVACCDQGDYRGLVVNIAARLSALATAGHVLVSERCADAAFVPGERDVRSIRGLAERMAVRSLETLAS